MATYRSSTHVDRSPATVFATAVDPARWAEWSDMTDITTDGSMPLRIGSSGTFRMTEAPFRGPARYEVTELDSGRRIRYLVNHPAFTWESEVSVAPDGDGSELTSAGDFRLRGAWRLLAPIVNRELSRGEARELERLKSLLELQPTPMPQRA